MIVFSKSAHRIRLSLLLFTILFSAISKAQQDSVPVIELDTVIIEAARLQIAKDELPASVSVKEFGAIQQNLQQLTANDYLQGIPGLFVLNSNNFAQDTRISIRGFGARSAFGIRGVRLVIDGIPETTPDGQGQVDNLNLALIERIEVLRGASSSLYGNASGGVINVSTKSNFSRDFVELSSAIGSYNFQSFQAIAGIRNKKSKTVIFANRTTSDGFRANSRFETNQFNLRTKLNTGNKTSLNFQLNYTDSPMAQDAGGITQEDVDVDRTQARDRNVDFDTGESVRQFKTGVALQWRPSKLNLNSFVYYSYRDFANKLPFSFGGAVDLVRNYWGHGSNASFDFFKDKGLLTAQVGYELASQNDRRTRFINDLGSLGDVTLQQNEIFQNLGAFAILQSKIEKWVFRGGLRYDNNILEVKDTFLDNGDASDRIVLNTINPSIGLRFKVDKNQSLFANFATSFETPVLSELSANPNDDGGFNQNLNEQTSTTFEGGYTYSKPKFRLETTVFYIETEDDIVPFELEAFPDRTFFRNAGSAERFGLEVSTVFWLNNTIRFNASYAWSRFTYNRFEIPLGNFNGNRLPGVPEHLAFLQGLYRSPKGLVIRWNMQYRGDFFANDSNAVTEASAVISNLSVSQKLSFDGWNLSPYFGINNLFDTQYNDNVRLNAFGGRFFEPAPGINVYGGLRISL
ncbi:TonB-dependent receptor family protein [Flagellimonas sp. S174]|uniref:TonB-dependent receptor family protein n=1 Tax=Flagellimonas sp. S174 TaxID=3410790 RepID=UPI003BF57C55